MNQLGIIFRDARTESGKSIDDAVKETKIAKKYLIAIENEDFDVFPGETYLLGFIRNYAQFLGLDPDEMILRYRDYKIQEQPAPIEQLTAKPKNAKRYALVILIIVMIVSSILYVLLMGKKEKEIEEGTPKAEEEVAKAKEEPENVVVFEEEELIRDFKKGDIIEITKNNEVYHISIDGISENLEFSIGNIPFSLSTDERVEIDFNRDGRKDVLIRTNRLGEGSVNLTLRKIFKTKKLEMGTESSDSLIAEAERAEGVSLRSPTAGPPEVVIIKEDDLFAKLPVAPKSGFQIVSSYEKTEINTYVKAHRTSYFGYIVDEGDKEEMLLRNGDEIAFTAKDVLRIMVTPADGVDLQINEISLSLGNKGEVVAKIVRWYRNSDDTDLYYLIINDWEK